MTLDQLKDRIRSLGKHWAFSSVSSSSSSSSLLLLLLLLLLQHCHSFSLSCLPCTSSLLQEMTSVPASSAHTTNPLTSTKACRVRVCVCAYACVRMRVCVCMCVCSNTTHNMGQNHVHCLYCSQSNKKQAPLEEAQAKGQA